MISQVLIAVVGVVCLVLGFIGGRGERGGRWDAFTDGEVHQLMEAIENGDWDGAIAREVSHEGWRRGLHPQQAEREAADQG